MSTIESAQHFSEAASNCAPFPGATLEGVLVGQQEADGQQRYVGVYKVPVNDGFEDYLVKLPRDFPVEILAIERPVLDPVQTVEGELRGRAGVPARAVGEGITRADWLARRREERAQRLVSGLQSLYELKDRAVEQLGLASEVPRPTFRESAEVNARAVGNVARGVGEVVKDVAEQAGPLLRQPALRAVAAVTVVGAGLLPLADHDQRSLHSATKEHSAKQEHSLETVPPQKLIHFVYTPSHPTHLRAIAADLHISKAELEKLNPQWGDKEIPAGKHINVHGVAGVVGTKRPVSVQAVAKRFGLTEDAVLASNQVDEDLMIHDQVRLPGRVVYAVQGQVDPHALAQKVGVNPKAVEFMNRESNDGLLVVPTQDYVSQSAHQELLRTLSLQNAQMPPVVEEPSSTTLEATTSTTSTMGSTTTSTTIETTTTTETPATTTTLLSQELSSIDTSVTGGEPLREDYETFTKALYFNHRLAIARLLDVIAHGEGSYVSFNHGLAGDAHGKYFLPDGRQITELTLREIRQKQALPKGHPDRLFAVGRSQMIPPTLGSAIQSTHVDMDSVFTPELQDNLTEEYLLHQKRKNLKAYIEGDPDASLVDAEWDICKEWASKPCPPNGAHGFYDGDGAGNGAAGGKALLNEVGAALIDVRVTGMLYRQAMLLTQAAFQDAAQEPVADSPATPVTSTTTSTMTAPVSQEPHGLVVIGDSLSVGYKQTLLQEASNYNLHVIDVNARVGRALARGKDNGATVVESETALSLADAVVLALGTNMPETELEYAETLRKTIEEVRKQRPEIRIFIPRLFSFKDGTLAGERRKTRNDIIDSIASETGAVPISIDQAVDTAQERKQHMSTDEVHLDGTTYKVTARSLMQQITTIINQGKE